MRRYCAVVWLGLVLLATGCHSAYVEAKITNETGQVLSPVELDYPSASLGTETLAAGASYNYRFKVQGSGDLKLLYTDVAHHDHTVTGPKLNEGDEGTLSVTIEPAGVQWMPKVKGR